MSASKCIERSRREHEDLVAEFNSLMSGVEASLQATGMKIERLSKTTFPGGQARAQSAGKRQTAVPSSERIAGL